MRRDRRGGDEVRRVLAGHGEPGEAAGQLSGSHHQHRHQQDQRALAVAEAAPQQQRRRQQVQQLHQRLRDQPGIAAQQRPFLQAQRARARSLAEAVRATLPAAGRHVPRWPQSGHRRRSAARTP